LPELLYLLIVGFVGLVIGIPSYVTWQRRWPGMIAGFDRSRCSDVDGLTRWVGGVGMIIGGAMSEFPAAFANVLGFPVQHGLTPDSVLDLSVVNQGLGGYLAVVHEEVEEPSFPG